MDAPWQLAGDDGAGAASILALVQAAFAGMNGRIDPPSSAVRLGVAEVAAQARAGEVWAIGRPPVACVFLTPRAGALHVGKLAVAEAARRRGLARRLIALAEARAVALRLPALELQTRVERVENHATFAALGFRQVAATAHPGFARPTSLTWRRELSGGGAEA